MHLKRHGGPSHSDAILDLFLFTCSSYKQKKQEINMLNHWQVRVQVPPSPLLVMRESEEQVEKHPHGYAFKDDPKTTLNKNVGFVTIDRVWQLDSMLPIATPQLKDLCLSFALFKLLRC